MPRGGCVCDARRVSSSDTEFPARLEAVLAAVLAGEGIALTSVAFGDFYARPGAETSVRVSASTSAGPRELVVTDAPLEPSSHVVRAQSGERAYAAWLHPFDPLLPGLERALDAPSVAQMLGVRVDALDLVVYRPLRRAVVRVTGEQELYLKVVRPSRVHRILRAVAAVGGVTAPVVDLGDGVVAMHRAAGAPLINLVANPAVTAAQVDAVVAAALAALPDVVVALPEIPSWVERRDTYATHARSRGLNPEHIDAVVGATLGAAAGWQATHGDLNLTNVRFDFVGEEPQLASLIDVESAGPGQRSDDLACMVAHIAALWALDPAAYPHTAQLADDLMELWRPRAPGLPARAAAVLLTLASTQDAPAIAASWLATAASFATMRELSRPSPSGLAGGHESVVAGPYGPSRLTGRRSWR